MTIFTLPDLGEGLPDAEIVEWHVKVGDFVKLDQVLVSMETAKAVVEVPSPIEGIIGKLFGKSGDLVHTGAPLVEFEGKAEHDRRNNPATAAGQLEIGNTIIQEQSLEQQQILAAKAAQNKQPIDAMIQGNGSANTGVKATPAIRALAQQLQVDLTSVTATGPGGTITKQDLEQATASLSQAGPLQPLRGVRRAMAQSMAKSHTEVVPITVMDDAKLLHWPEKEDVTVRLMQAVIIACQKQPDLNAWFDTKAMARRLWQTLHLGIAMDTEEGLFVPVLHDAEKLNKTELRAALDQLKRQVLDRTIASENLRGATFTLSNVGIFSGRYANPVVIPPTVAILAAGRIREEVVALQGNIQICKVLPLALTFDHRAVTGGEATRFLAAVIQSLEQDQK